MACFNIFTDFFANRQQRVSVHGNFSQFKSIVFGVHQGSVLGWLVFILYTAEMWNDFENKIILYADDTILYTEVASLSDRINVVDSLNRDLFQIQSWCSMWGMKLNPFKTHSIIHLGHPIQH